MILMVTSRETRRWVVPKGWQEKKIADPEQAAREAYEEAGAIGQVGMKPIGAYRYEKRLKNGRSKTLDVAVYLFEVEELLDEWPEMDERERRWMTPAQAALAVDEGSLAALLLGLEATPPRLGGPGASAKPSAGRRPGRALAHPF
ncbi:NUDIX hydrolase [Skermanella mucosa]|uniref:NUDIX hydrolase n=1 Tax=Skermanella mucosa TaxID=1789672 RepID=UPI00389ACC1C